MINNNIINDNEKLKNLFLSQDLSRNDLAFICFLYPFITKPDNDIRINKKYLKLEDVGKLVGFSKNVVTKIINSLEENDIIRVIKGGNKPPIIYFNPNLFYINEPSSEEIYTLFKEPFQKVRNQKTFFEKELEQLLINNLDLIEPNMTLLGNQYKVQNGYIDILARDQNNTLCIIELKVVANDSKLIEQCVYYPTQFQEPTRMIAIAPKYNDKIYTALSYLNVEIKQYKFENDNLIIHNY